MSSILQNPSHVAQIGYNGFNMEQTADFTAAPFMLLPVYYDVLNPGDKVRLNSRVKLRSQPLESAAEFSATVRVDWFAVPMEQIFKFFGSMYYNIQDIGTDLITNLTQTATTFPYIPVQTIKQDLINRSTQYSSTSPTSPISFESKFYRALNDSFDARVVETNDRLRLLDCLGVPVSAFCQQYLPIGTNSIFPYLFCAYQKIYYDYFRLSDREANDPSYYNLDSGYNTALLTVGKFLKLSQLQYAPYNKDFFTNVFVSPLQGSQDIGSLGLQSQMFQNWLSGGSASFHTKTVGSSNYAPNGGYGVNSNTQPTTIGVDPSFSQASAASIGVAAGFINSANVRGMFALEKALEITRRSGKHYDAQTLAHWGVSVPDQIAGECSYLGSQTQPFVVGDVVSTSATANEPLGTIAGKAYSSPALDGSRNDNISYEAKTHTVVMAIFSVIPQVTYSQNGLDKLNTLAQSFDWVHPETDNLGQQPLFYYQRSLIDWSAASGSSLPGTNDVFNWQYAYSELKIKSNRVFGAVHNMGTMYSWVPQVDFNYWLPGNRGTITQLTMNDFFYGQPGYFNNIFTYQYLYENALKQTSGATPSYYFDYASIYARDPFIVHAEFSCVKSSKMSKYSLPNL